MLNGVLCGVQGCFKAVHWVFKGSLKGVSSDKDGKRLFLEQCSIVLYKFAFKFRLKVVHILHTSLLHGPFIKVQQNCSVEVVLRCRWGCNNKILLDPRQT